ncbi:MAG: FecR domain-containing protein [Candidatus Aminicenantes bacterium]
MKKNAIFAALLLLFFTLIYAEMPEYTQESIARLSYVSGNAFIQRSSELTYEEGVINMPIAQGDRVGTTDGRAEVYFGKGKYIRLDNKTKVDFINLPNRGNDLTQFRIWSGHVYFRVNSLNREKSLEIHTADVSVYVLNEGLYRIDVRENQETEILVFNGLIEAAGESGSVLIKEAQKLVAIEGHFTSRPNRFHAVSEDSFDRWNEDRDYRVRERMAQVYLPDELEDYEGELQNHGDWTYVDPYGYVWIPRAIKAQWRPYHNGQWVWISICGWTWLPYEPWGWVTSHFGRWQWSVEIGWYWIPMTDWGPAWVSWYWGNDYCAWAPMSYYGYPGVIIDKIYYPRYADTYYPFYSEALTAIRKSQLQEPHVAQISLDRESTEQIGRISLSKKPPTMKPKSQNVQIEKLSENKVFLYKSEKSKDLKRFVPEAQDKYLKYPDLMRQRDKIQQESSYPPSPQITLKQLSKKLKNADSKSPVSSFIDYISKGIVPSDKFVESKDSYGGSSSQRVQIKSKTHDGSKTSKIKSSNKSSPKKAPSSSRKSKSTKTKKKK